MNKDITAINLSNGLVLLDSDETIPIISIMDHCFLSEVKICVAGPCSDGKWYVFTSDDFQNVTIQWLNITNHQ